MKRVLFFLTSFFIGIALFIWTIKFVGWSEISAVFHSFSIREGFIVLGLTFLIIFLATWRWQEVLKNQGYKIPISKLLKPFLASHLVSYLAPIIPFSADVLRGYILKEKTNVPLKIAVSSAIIDRILEITSHFIIILFGVLYFLLKIGLPPQNLAIILGSGFLIGATLLFFSYFKILRKESLVKIFLRGETGNRFFEVEREIFIFFNLKKFNFWKILIFAFLREAAALYRTYVLVFFLGKSLNFFSSLSVLSFSTLVQAFPIPADLGVYEVIQIFVFNGLGLGMNTAAAFTIITRGADIIFALFGIFVIVNFGVSLIKKIFIDKKENSKIA